MKNFNHPHVLKLLGVCVPSHENPMVVLPYMSNGDLRSYVKDKKKVCKTNTENVKTCGLSKFLLVVFVSELHCAQLTHAGAAGGAGDGLPGQSQLRASRSGSQELHVSLEYFV